MFAASFPLTYGQPKKAKWQRHKNMFWFIRSTSQVSSYAQTAIGISSAMAYAQTKINKAAP